jgi:regulator of protease activity HflC (stomatin/prohibitin superfamily)
MNSDLLMMNWNVNSNEPVKARGFRCEFVIQEYECGLLYRHGKFQSRLDAGRHVRWGRGFALATVDLRKQTFPVAGQEVLSADNVGLKISVAVMMQVADPLKAMHEVQDWRSHLYNIVQLALRALVAAQPVEGLLVQRLDIGKQLLADVQLEAQRIGLMVHAAEVKDVMFPGDIKKAFTEVLKAKQEGQAALERARGESAALRNLANAARLLESNPALQNLRLMQSMSAAGNTLVMGLPTGFVPLKAGKTVSSGSDARADESGEQ